MLVFRCLYFICIFYIFLQYWRNNRIIWTASSEFGTYRLCEQRRFRRACTSAQSRQNLRCSLIQAVNQEQPLDRKPDPWPLWMAGHVQLKFVMTECWKTQIRLSGLILYKKIKIYIAPILILHEFSPNLDQKITEKHSFNFH